MISGRLAFFSLALSVCLAAIWFLWIAVTWAVGSDHSPNATAGGEEYTREAFGRWIDSNANCLNTRAEILLERSLSVPVLDESGCRVVGGVWKDAYTGDLLSDPRSIDVDHLVPLHFAWIAGASEWPDSNRVAFMNDPGNLVLTAASVNRSKGNATPADWLPPDPAAQCWFLRTFLSVVAEHGLRLPDQSVIPDMENRVCN